MGSFLYKKKAHLQRKKCANTIQITRWAAYLSSKVLQKKCVGSLSDLWNLIHCINFTIANVFFRFIFNNSRVLLSIDF